MLFSYLLIFSCGFILGASSILFLKKIIPRYNILISKGIPLIGGIGIGVSFILTSLFFYFYHRELSSEIIGVIISSAIMLIFGVIDDLRELSVKNKFLVQIIATTLLILFGVKTQIVYIGDVLNIIITFVWVIGIANAINHLDVIDGLAGSTAMVVSLAFFSVSFLNNDVVTAVLTLALTGAIISFLAYNFPPAKVYMGNAGSHFLGFILAAIALMISYAPLERKVALLSPVLILGFPIFDTAFLVWIRMKNKKSIFRKSNDHLALRFLALGYSKKKALSAMLALCLFFSISGILVSQASNYFGITIIVLVVFISLLLTRSMSRVPANG